MLNEVLHFWFDELSPQQWFTKDTSLDQLIIKRFKSIHEAAAKSELFEWRDSTRGRLAEIIILDQFSRNIFRDSAQAFLQDPLALALAQEAIRLGLDKELNATEKSFIYMPYMHSESKLIHQQAVKLFSQPELEYNLEFELKH